MPARGGGDPARPGRAGEYHGARRFPVGSEGVCSGRQCWQRAQNTRRGHGRQGWQVAPYKGRANLANHGGGQWWQWWQLPTLPTLPTLEGVHCSTVLSTASAGPM